MSVKQSSKSTVNAVPTDATQACAYEVTVRWVDASDARPTAKRLSVNERTVTRDHDGAHRFTSGCLRNARMKPWVAIVSIVVSCDGEVVASWQPTGC